MAAQRKYPLELKDRATRLAVEARRDHGELGHLPPPVEYEAAYETNLAEDAA